MADRAAKYDQLAERFAERSYANLHLFMHRQFIIATTWGASLQPGDSVLELGCGNGYLAQLFVQYGLCYHGVDISPKMVVAAERRLGGAGLEANFMVVDVNQIALSEPVDAVIAYMRNFFQYVHEPLAVLKRLRPYIRKKLVIDLNPRRDIPLQEALATLQAAGFCNIAWRPFFVPTNRRLPLWLLKALVFCEDIPLVQAVPLRWKFLCLLRGEQ